MFRGKRKWIWIIVGVVVVAGLVAANLTKDRTKRIDVFTDFAERGELVEAVSASGKIHPVMEVNVSAKVTAEITALPVEEGQFVNKGDLLVKLDPTDYREAVEQAEQRLRSAQAMEQKARSKYDQTKGLFDKNLESAFNLENAEADLEIANSGVDQVKASLKDARDKLAKTEIYAPMSGTITILNKELGEIVSEAMFREDVIMVVADLSQMEVQVEVDENDVVDVEIGDPVEIEIDAFPDTTFRGEVVEISHSATTRGYGTQEEVTNFLVKIRVLDDIERLRPGMSSTVDVEVHRLADVISVPIQCVVMRKPEKEEPDSLAEDSTLAMADKKDKKKKKKDKEKRRSFTREGEDEDKEDWIEVIFVVEEEVAKQRVVKTGISSESNIQIIDGVEEGEEVVSGSYRVLGKELEDGDDVKVKSKWDSDEEDE